MEATPSTLNSIFVSSTQARVGVSSTVPTHTLSVGGDINFSGSLYQNGAEFVGGGGGGDNLGSHIATMTIQAPYGIYASTISLTNTGNSITSAGGISVFANTSGLNNLGVFYFSQASNPYRMYLSDPTKTLSLVAGDGGKMSVLSTSGTELLGVKNNGAELALVGISSTTPTHTLSVQGDINYSGTLYKNGTEWPSGYDFVPSTATGYYGIYVASANYAANGGGGGIVQSSGVIDGSPIGTIIAYSTTTPPSGYLYCDGSYVSTTTYADLFAITGHRYSTYTVTGTPSVFQLPDLRGMFLRGALGNLNSRDPNANRVVGSTQTDTIQGHWHAWTPHYYNGFRGDAAHRYADELNGSPTLGAYIYGNRVREPISDGTNGTVRISTETRPENTAVAYMIKYAHTGAIDISSTALVTTSTLTWTGSNTFTGAVSVSSITHSGYAAFTSPTSTTTFAGWIDIGYVVVSNNGGTTNNIRVGCPTGLKVLGGSCTSSSDAHIHYSYPSPDLGDGTAGAVPVSDGATNAYSWSCATLGAPRNNLIAYAICARIK